MSAWIEDPRDDDPIWWPICEDCDQDAVTLRYVNAEWWFYCVTHSRLGDKTIQQVRDGLRPARLDRAWNAAWTAIQGVRKLDDEELAMYQLIARELA